MARPNKNKRRETQYTRDTGVARLTHQVMDFIKSKGRGRESMDQILRRVFKMKPWAPKEEEKTIRG